MGLRWEGVLGLGEGGGLGVGRWVQTGGRRGLLHILCREDEHGQGGGVVGGGGGVDGHVCGLHIAGFGDMQGMGVSSCVLEGLQETGALVMVEENSYCFTMRQRHEPPVAAL